MKKRRLRPGQAIVETALMGTLLFFLISAAVDVGLIFLSYQAIASAAQEGASYGSFYRGNAAPDAASIRLRVRNEGGTDSSQTNLVNLMDLDSNGVKDDAYTQGEGNPNGYILISYSDTEVGREFGTDCLLSDTLRVAKPGHCQVDVTVKFTYRPFFFLAPFFGVKEYTIEATRSMTIVEVY